jgi:regulator of RNase E activity RraA
VGCGGVAIFPGDVISADGDGAVVIPKALLAEVTQDAIEQERHEGWVIEEVRKGVPLPGLYPANAENKARYEAWRKNQDK